MPTKEQKSQTLYSSNILIPNPTFRMMQLMGYMWSLMCNARNKHDASLTQTQLNFGSVKLA